VLYPAGWAVRVELLVFTIVTASLVAFVVAGPRRHPVGDDV
jgi:hypothetical protein